MLEVISFSKAYKCTLPAGLEVCTDMITLLTYHN